VCADTKYVSIGPRGTASVAADGVVGGRCPDVDSGMVAGRLA